MDNNAIEISYPPYPKNTATPADLLGVLMRLRDWVEEQRVLLVLRAGLPALPVLPAPPTATVVAALSVSALWQNFTLLRLLRQSWDAVVRDHEDAWESKLSLQRQHALVGAACETLRLAFLSSEQREAHYQKEQELAAAKAYAFLRRAAKASRRQQGREEEFPFGDNDTDADAAF